MLLVWKEKFRCLKLISMFTLNKLLNSNLKEQQRLLSEAGYSFDNPYNYNLESWMTFIDQDYIDNELSDIIDDGIANYTATDFLSKSRQQEIANGGKLTFSETKIFLDNSLENHAEIGTFDYWYIKERIINKDLFIIFKIFGGQGDIETEFFGVYSSLDRAKASLITNGYIYKGRWIKIDGT